MNNRSKTLIAGVALILMTLTVNTQGQRTRRPAENAPRKAPATKAIDPADKWWGAQRSIETAIQQLEEYLRRYPNGKRAESARQQLEALRGLTAAASKPEWATLHLGPAVTSDWRVASVDPQPDKTRITLEIRCAQGFNGECGFPAFDSGTPLVLLNSAGSFYPMLRASEMPEGVRRVDGHPSAQYRFQPGRTISVEVEFAPLAKGAASGQIQYRERNSAVPAKFSLVRQQ